MPRMAMLGTSSTLHYSRDEGGSYVCQVATVIGFIINSNASIQSTLLIRVRCDNLLVDNAIEEDDATVDTECLGSTVGSCWDRPSALLPINLPINRRLFCR
jgi:hypothetical protein